jgi:glutaminyl-tRNA synthetase
MDVEEDRQFTDYLNADSIEVVKTCRVEPSLARAEPGTRFQFERLGYFCLDSVDSAQGRLVFNRTVTLRDTWAKIREAAASD